MRRLIPFVTALFQLSAMQAFGFIDRIVYGDWDGKGGDKITQTLGLMMILESLFLFYLGYKKTRSIGKSGTLALLAVGVLFISYFWSGDPGATVRQSLNYFYVILGCIGVAALMDGEQFMRSLSFTCVLCALGSIVIALLVPRVAFSGAGGVDYQGIFSHKNFLGQVMAIGALATLHALRTSRQHRFRHFLFLAIFAIMAVASKSAAAGLAVFVFCAAEILISLYRRGGVTRILAISAAVVLVPLLSIVAFDPDPLLELIGKDPTLTGRTEIWAFVIDDIWQKPLLGWGFFGFWVGSNPAAREISDTVHWVVPQAHNGLLEMLLNVGIVGTSIFVYILFRNMALALRCFRAGGSAIAISTIFACFSVLLFGVSETVLLAPTQSPTSLFFISGMICERMIAMARRQRRRQPVRSDIRGKPSYHPTPRPAIAQSPPA